MCVTAMKKSIVYSQQTIPLSDIKLNSLNEIKNKYQIFLPKRHKISFLLHFFNIPYYIALYSYAWRRTRHRASSEIAPAEIQYGGRFAEGKKMAQKAILG